MNDVPYSAKIPPFKYLEQKNSKHDYVLLPAIILYILIKYVVSTNYTHLKYWFKHIYSEKNCLILKIKKF